MLQVTQEEVHCSPSQDWASCTHASDGSHTESFPKVKSWLHVA